MWLQVVQIICTIGTCESPTTFPSSSSIGALMISPAPHSFLPQEAHVGWALFDSNQSRSFCFCDSSRPTRTPFSRHSSSSDYEVRGRTLSVMLLNGDRGSSAREKGCRVARRSPIAVPTSWPFRRVRSSSKGIRSFLYSDDQVSPGRTRNAFD